MEARANDFHICLCVLSMKYNVSTSCVLLASHLSVRHGR